MICFERLRRNVFPISKYLHHKKSWNFTFPLELRYFTISEMITSSQWTVNNFKAASGEDKWEEMGPFEKSNAESSPFSKWWFMVYVAHGPIIPRECGICLGSFGIVRKFDFYLCYFLCKKKFLTTALDYFFFFSFWDDLDVSQLSTSLSLQWSQQSE